MFLKRLPLLLLFLCALGSSANEGPWQVSSSAHYGFIIQHRSAIQSLIQGHARALEFQFSKPSSGKKDWHRIYKLPETGVKIYVGDLGNPDQLGMATAVIPYINFPFIRSKHVLFGFHVGTGLGYLSKKFERIQNHKNVAISSSINGAMHGKLEADYSISSHVGLSFGLALTHFSNGAYKVPNLGINIVTVSAGLKAMIGNHQIIPDTNATQDILIKAKAMYRYEIQASAGLKEVYPYGGRKYPVYDFAFLGLKKLNRKSLLGLGADVFVNTSFNYLLSDSAGNAPSPESLIKLGVSVPYELEISKLTMAFRIGFYLLNPYPKDGFMYQMVGLHYALGKNLYANYSLKLHFGRADNLELGLGYAF